MHQTHISAVFLAGPYAYKIKKPLDLGFLAFTTLERRRHFCSEEVRLNRRLEPGVYLGTVPVSIRGDRVCVGEGEKVLDYAVKMRRLPEDRSLEVLLRRGALEIGTLDDLAGRLARFHAGAEGGERISRAGSWKAVARNCRENFAQIESFEDEVPAEERSDALTRARAHFLLALGKFGAPCRAALPGPRGRTAGHGEVPLGRRPGSAGGIHTRIDRFSAKRAGGYTRRPQVRSGREFTIRSGRTRLIDIASVRLSRHCWREDGSSSMPVFARKASVLIFSAPLGSWACLASFFSVRRRAAR